MKYYPDEDKYWNQEIQSSLGYLYGLVLDVGAGHRTPHAWDITVDNKIKGVNYTAEANKLPFPDNHFDCVYAGHVLEHMEDILGTLKEWLRVVKPMGYIVIICPDYEFTPNIGSPHCDPQHKHDLSYEILRRICKLLSNAVVINKNQIALKDFSFQIVLKKLNENN